MEPLRVDFLQDNLAFGSLPPETCEEVAEAAGRGTIAKTVEGWPIISLERDATRFVLDGPLHYQLIERLGKEPDCVVVVFGVGVGNTVRALRAAGVRVALIFEPDPGLLRSFLEHGPNDLGPIPIVTHQRELESIWTREVGDRDNIHVADTPGYEHAFSEERQALTTKIADLLERNLVNEQTVRARGRVWIDDIVENAEYMAKAPSALHLQGAFPKVPAFIIGAGPSLNKNLHLLEQATESGIVFAVNSSGRALDRAGVKPQILAALESVDVSPLIADLSFIDDVVRLFSLTAHPNLFRTGKGPLLTLFELLPHIAGPFETFFGRPGLPVCGSVSTACFSLAYRMGCDPIVLVGQDLAYTGGRCYADGTPFEASRIEVEGTNIRHEWCEAMIKTNEKTMSHLLPGQKATTAPAWGGEGHVYSAATFNHVRRWFERVAGMLAKSGGPSLINATEGGASIEGFLEVPLSEVLSGLTKQQITSQHIMDKAHVMGPVMTLEHVSQLLLSNERGADAVANAAQRMALASQAAAAVWEDNDPRLLSRRLKDVEQAEAELKQLVARFPWVDAWAWADVDEALEAVDEVEGLPEALQGIRSESRLGEAIFASAKALAERLGMRRESLKEKH